VKLVKRPLKKIIMFVLIVVITILALSESPPVVTIDYKQHESLWRAQRNLVLAYEAIEKAPEASQPISQKHTRRAQELLNEADRELRLAASSLHK